MASIVAGSCALICFTARIARMGFSGMTTVLDHGFHPLKARQPGQFRICKMSTVRGALHPEGNFVTGLPDQSMVCFVVLCCIRYLVLLVAVCATRGVMGDLYPATRIHCHVWRTSSRAGVGFARAATRADATDRRADLLR